MSTCSDKDLVVATQIAYANLHSAVEALGEDITVGEAMEYNIKKNLTMWDNYKSYFDITYDSNNNVVSAKFKEEYSDFSDWKIVKVCNDNEVGQSGFYGCIFDTGDERIVSCRGSESMKTIKNITQDWIKGDFKLLNSTQTEQEKVLREFLIKNKRLLNEKKWISTGHSLGGALADHAAIVSIEEGIGNFDGAFNYDGPGHSDDYIKKHADAIEQIASKMKHYKTSIVGSILFDIPGVQQIYFETSYESHLLDEEGNPIHTASTDIRYYIEKHSTQYWDFDESGGVYEREPDNVEKGVQSFTTFVDSSIPIAGGLLVSIFEIVATTAYWIECFFDKHPDLKQQVIEGIVGYIIQNPQCIIAAIKTCALIILCVAVIILAVAVLELLVKEFKEFLQKIVDAVCETIDWLKGKAVELFKAVCDLLGQIGDFWKQLFNGKGEKYSQENPLINVDTDLLYDYGNRLELLNQRISDLDREISSLYWQVGFLDLWDIMQADILVHYSYGLKKAKYYLYNTAERFEKADRKAIEYLGG